MVCTVKPDDELHAPARRKDEVRTLVDFTLAIKMRKSSECMSVNSNGKIGSVVRLNGALNRDALNETESECENGVKET